MDYHWMNTTPCLFYRLLYLLGLLFPVRVQASDEYNAQIPQLVFAARELNSALREATSKLRNAVD